jgi:hypothetical protein
VRHKRPSIPTLAVQQRKSVEPDDGKRHFQSLSDDEHDENEHDPFGVHEERHMLLRSKSCPAGSPTAIDTDGFNY